MNLLDLQMKIPCKWRVQSYSKNKPSAQCVAYIDARQVASILDEVVGAGNWQVDYKTVNDLLFAGIGIKIEGDWIWKWDTGSETQVEKDKGHVSDSFKRAGVQWGIGRFLYDMEIQYVKANEIKNKTNFPYPIDNNGKRIWDLTKHINQLQTPVQKSNKVDPKSQKTAKTQVKKDELVVDSDEFKKLVDIAPKYSVDQLLKMAKKKYEVSSVTEQVIRGLYIDDLEEIEFEDDRGDMIYGIENSVINQPE